MNHIDTMKLALNKAFQLGQRYWSWADSEYSSHWKKADAAKAEFDQLVQDTINAALAEQPAQKCSYPYCGCNSKAWCKVERNEALDKKAENARELGLDYEPAQQPAQQEPVAWRNAALRVGEDLCSVGPFGYYDMTAEQWLDWALSVVTVHTPPAQRKPLTDERPAQQALDKKAENARELGLMPFYGGDYEPVQPRCKVGGMPTPGHTHPPDCMSAEAT